MSKLKDYCLNITDGEHGTISEDKEGDYYLLNNNNITETGIIINESDRRISKQNYEKMHKRTQMEKGDVVIATCGTLGKTQVITDEVINYEFSRSVGIYKCDKEKLLPYYLHYAFKNPISQKKIENCAKGAIQKHFYIQDMEEFEIEIPDILSQQKIVNVVKSIDDKIQNNNKINAELESMAKSIYDYWFLQFEFPNEEGKPYKLSGGKMVWNEELKREIPEGWEVTYLSELCDFNNGINYDKDELGDKNYSIINVRNITSSTLLLDKSDFDIINLKSSQADKYLVEKDDILIARSGTPGAVRLLESDIENIIYCGFIIRCKPLNPVQRYYLAYSLKLLEGSNATKTGGSIMQNVSQDTLKQINICIPDDDVIEKYNNSISVILSKMQNVIEENRELTSLRDFLLPLLMNGQVGFK